MKVSYYQSNYICFPSSFTWLCFMYLESTGRCCSYVCCGFRCCCSVHYLQAQGIRLCKLQSLKQFGIHPWYSCLLFLIGSRSLQLRLRRQGRLRLPQLRSQREPWRRPHQGSILRRSPRRSPSSCHLLRGWLLRIRSWRQVRGSRQIRPQSWLQTRLQTQVLNVWHE